ncbi:MAG: hypothetical protein U5N86_12260 [Planctomycetota bacterium]|nr:hypothetical protein [Planctomycetota bacterium]
MKLIRCRTIYPLLLAALTLFVALPFSHAEDTAEDLFAAKLERFISMRAENWRKLADFSYANRLYSYARLDDQRARKLGAPPKEKRKYPNEPNPPGAVKLYGQWANMRTEMLARVDSEGIALLEWCRQNYRPGVRRVANEITEELPYHRAAHEALGEHYSEVLGWVKGKTADKVREGLLPFGKGWLERDKVLELRGEWANAWEVDKEHFIVRTNTTPALSQKLLDFMIAFRKCYLRRFEDFRFRRTDMELTLNLFADMKSFDIANKYLFPNGSPPSNIAFYFERTGQTYVVAGTGKDGYLFSRETVAHESSHQFLHQYSGVYCSHYYDKPGAWINEGLASYSQTALVTANRVTLAGYRSHYHFNIARQMLRKGTMEPLEEFVLMDGSEFSGSRRSARYYSYGMAVISYLLNAENGKYRDDFYRYVYAILRGRGSETLFERTFKEAPAHLEPAFHEWLLLKTTSESSLLN